MPDRTQIQTVLAAFATSCGLGRLELGADGRAGLTIGEVPVTLRYLETPAELLVVGATIVEIAEDDSATASFLLELTFTTWLKGLMTIGLSRDGRRALGYQAIPVRLLDAGTLAAVLGQMVETTLSIRGELARGAASQGAATPGSNPEGDAPLQSLGTAGQRPGSAWLLV